MSYTFSKADRILKRNDFITLSKHGKRIHNKYFTIVFLLNEIGRCRLGITVTRKVGKAAIRNKLKRRCREYFRINRHKILGCWDINLIVKKQAVDLTKRQADKELDNIFKKLSSHFENKANL